MWEFGFILNKGKTPVTTKQELLKIAAGKMGLIVKTSNPGDGEIRYRFIYADMVNGDCYYDSVTYPQIAETCLGWSEAVNFLSGVFVAHKLIYGKDYWANNTIKDDPDWVRGLALRG